MRVPWPSRDRTRRTQPPAGGAAEAEAPCPVLGFFNAPDRRATAPTVLHRCFALNPPERISIETQQTLCLTTRYPACDRYVAAFGTPAPPPELMPALAPTGTAPDPLPPP